MLEQFEVENDKNLIFGKMHSKVLQLLQQFTKTIKLL